MAERKVEFEWYVMNGDRMLYNEQFKDYPYSNHHIRPWNIFNNTGVYEETIKLCKNFKRKKMSFEDFTEELRKIIQWEEWSRCEYEISVGRVFEDDCNNLEKIDCYMQVLPNIKILAMYVLNTYYPRLHIRINENKFIMQKEKGEQE